MLISPIFDFFTVAERRANWTVTMSALAFVQTGMLFFAIPLLSLKSRREKMFFRCMAGFFLYAFLYAIYAASDLFYPMFGLISALGSTLVSILFYVSVRDNIVSHKTFVYVLAYASVFVIVPLVLVQIDTAGYAQLTRNIGTVNVLFGYENPRAVGWISTICLSIMVAYLSTQPNENQIPPLFLPLIAISATALFWSGSRGGLAAFALSISILFFASQTRNYKGLLSALFFIGVGGAASNFFYQPSTSYGMFGRISDSLEQETIAAASSGRIELWNTTIAYIFERPLTGYGFFPHKNLDGYPGGSAHNIILDFWLWCGAIIGTIIILCGLLLWVRAFAFFRRANDQYVSALFCMMTTLCAYCMISGPYVRTFPIFLFAIATGVILGRRSAKAGRATRSES